MENKTDNIFNQTEMYKNITIGTILENIPETLKRIKKVRSMDSEEKFRVSTILSYFKENPEMITKYSPELVNLMEETGNYSVRNEASKRFKEFLR
jgi:hypothetical protein